MDSSVTISAKKSLPDHRNIHAGETIVVCGCGASLNEFERPGEFITIGVNDVGRLFTPTYLVVLNPRQQFKNDRFKYVEQSKAQAIFTQLDLNLNHPNVVKFKLGQRGGTDFSNPNVLHYSQNSPYLALFLAAYMGAKRIGLIGVDFTDHHFFGHTGRHVLTPQLASIDAEYRALGQAFARQGIEVINLSQKSRITAFKKGTFESNKKMDSEKNIANDQPLEKKPKIFFVHYKFLSCGDVFRDGLNHASADLGLNFDEAYWDDPSLLQKINYFQPDLIFVVHGRKFAQKWGRRFQNYNTAVWLLDEPYEVDDTSKFSGVFNTVFVNDPNTLHRHKDAHYLPVAYDPHIYFDGQKPRKHAVGFIGGYNSVRQNLLDALSQQGLLSYIVGGPWTSQSLNRICIYNNIPASETAKYYQQTKIVINIFREVHHYNTQKILAFSLNPRIYECLACGALIVTENRAEIEKLFPDLPVFETKEQLIQIVKELLDDSAKYELIQKRCFQRVKKHTYLNRLKHVVNLAKADSTFIQNSKQLDIPNPTVRDMIKIRDKDKKILDEWEDFGSIVKTIENGAIILSKELDVWPGAERGLVSRTLYSNVELSFEVNIKNNAYFIAKIQQEGKYNQLSNSYHILCNGKMNYLARHYHIFNEINIKRNIWEKLKFAYFDGMILVHKNDRLIFSIKDEELKQGYAFIGIKGGEVLLRNISIINLLDKKSSLIGVSKNYIILQESFTSKVPIVSIITTVYDRDKCLKECIRSVKRLTFKNYEHIVVADSPPAAILEKLINIVQQENDGRIKFLNLTRRYNNWGITTASAGLQIARGKYVCFLSDDNGYKPDHLVPLVQALENDPSLGFVYSSCLYAGRKVLSSPIPRPAQIDLGQPLFRRELFKSYFNNNLPFDMFAWDWYMIDYFLKRGIKWKHINRASFLFKLARYPQFIGA